jgi:hypothetical protein
MALKSREYYRKITSIEFEPLRLKDFSDILVYKKGSIRKKKRLFRKPKYITVTEDLYDDGYSLVNVKGLLNTYNYNIRYNEEKKFFYYPSKVTIRSTAGDTYHKFDTDEEANAFINDLKDKCKKCGNELL